MGARINSGTSNETDRMKDTMVHDNHSCQPQRRKKKDKVMRSTREQSESKFQIETL